MWATGLSLPCLRRSSGRHRHHAHLAAFRLDGSCALYRRTGARDLHPRRTRNHVLALARLDVQNAFPQRSYLQESSAFTAPGHRKDSRLQNARWFDGAGRELPEKFKTGQIFSPFGRDNYALLAQINHYPLGSMENFVTQGRSWPGRTRGPFARSRLLGRAQLHRRRGPQRSWRLRPKPAQTRLGQTLTRRSPHLSGIA